MTELIAALACLWIVALAGWSAHEWGKKVAGNIALLLSLIGFTVTAIFDHSQPSKEQPAIQPDALMVKHVVSSLPASSLEPVGSSHEPTRFVASRNGRTFNAPTCSHYVPYIKGPIWYDSEESAKADGKRPCSECLKK